MQNNPTAGANKSNANSSDGFAQQPNEIITFQFSESKQPIRNVLLDDKPWFVTKDVCDILGIRNSRDAIRNLDDDEKGVAKSDTLGGKQTLSIVSQSGLYALILRSNKPYAKTFRKWITSEVIPALLKKGYYSMSNPKSNNDFIDARDLPYSTQMLNDYPVRTIVIDDFGSLSSVNDINRAIHSSTSSNQLAKKLNAKSIQAYKVWVFGNTHPAWFTTSIGTQLIISGSRILKNTNQLKLAL